jgi:hypothetical protein
MKVEKILNIKKLIIKFYSPLKNQTIHYKTNKKMFGPKRFKILLKNKKDEKLNPDDFEVIKPGKDKLKARITSDIPTGGLLIDFDFNEELLQEEKRIDLEESKKPELPEKKESIEKPELPEKRESLESLIDIKVNPIIELDENNEIIEEKNENEEEEEEEINNDENNLINKNEEEKVHIMIDEIKKENEIKEEEIRIKEEEKEHIIKDEEEEEEMEVKEIDIEKIEDEDRSKYIFKSKKGEKLKKEDYEIEVEGFDTEISENENGSLTIEFYPIIENIEKKKEKRIKVY